MKRIQNALMCFAALALADSLSAKDNFSDRLPLTGVLPLQVSTDLSAAMNEALEPQHSILSRKKSATRWWTWIATANGWYQIDARVGEVDGVASVYEGTILDRLVPASSRVSINSTGSGLVQFSAVAGQSYEIAISGEFGQIGTVEFDLSAVPDAAINDHFGDRIDLGSALDVEVIGNNTGATVEPGEPDHLGGFSRASIWWQITPDTDRVYRVTGTASTLSREVGRINVYEGSELAGLTWVGGLEGFYGFFPILFEAKAGKTYQIAFDRRHLLTDAFPITIAIEAVEQPANDDFANALDLGSVNSATLETDLELATREVNEPGHSNPYSPGRLEKTVWWKWRAPADGLWVFERVSGSPSVAVYQSDVFIGLQEITPPGSRVTSFSAEQGLDYVFVMGTRSSVTTATARIEFKSLASVTNDNFADAKDLGRVANVVEPAYNMGATLESGEPSSGTNFLSSSLWWEWEAPNDTAYSIYLTDSTVRRVLNIYTGTALNNLVRLVPAFSSAVFEANAGQRYYLRMHGHPSSDDFFTLRIDEIPLTNNDNFANAIDLGRVDYAESNASSQGASMEAGEPAAPEPLTIWWRWEAPESGVWEFLTIDCADIEIFTGSELSNLVLVKEGDELERTAFVAIADTVYHIRLSLNQGYAEQITIRKGVPPLGDTRANATDLGSVFPAAGRSGLTGAGSEAGEPGERNVWWQWQAPVTGRFGISISNETNAKVYRGLPGDDFSQLQDAVIALVDEGSPAVFEAQAGERFMIVAYRGAVTPGEDGGGFVEMSIESFFSAPGDFFHEAIDLGSSTKFQIIAGATGASYEPGEPDHGAGRGGSIWHAWTAPVSGQYHLTGVTTEGEDINDGEYVAVYTGTDLTRLTLIGKNFGDEEAASLFFYAVVGTKYWIAFEGDEAYDLFRLQLDPVLAYDSWIVGEVTDIDDLGRDANPSGDGISNLMKFALGLRPVLNLSSDPAAANFPQLSIVSQFLELRYRVSEDVATPGLGVPEHNGESSRDGINWSHVESQSLGDRWFVVRVPIDDGTKLLRLKVEE
jgi:hypothetical protein